MSCSIIDSLFHNIPEVSMKSFIPALFMTLILSTTAYAGFNGPSDARAVTTVQEAVEAGEMTTCVLEGNIIRHTERNRYLFQDKSGSMVVDIPPHVFALVDVTPQDHVRITGEIGGKKRPDVQDPHLRVRYIEKLS